MLEALLITCLVYGIRFMPFRGKSYMELSEKQRKILQEMHTKYMRTKKGQQTLMTEESYLSVIQKNALTYLIMGIVLIPIYVVIVIYIYPTLWQI
jgi:hypothetical protein